ncbi:MAG: hypothetical protein R6U58_08020 [Bacteroidales bacterium]
MGKYLKIAFAAAITAFMATTACNKDEGCSIHPEAFRFSIIDSESKADLLAAEVYRIEDIGIHYFYNDERQDLIVNLETNPEGEYTELFSAQLPMISLTGRSDVFYLYLSRNVTDTLVVKMGNEMRDGCDYHPYATVIHNGRNLPIAEEGKAFILEK